MGLFKTTHIHQSRTEYIPYEKTVNITEKKAPTDESIKLLNEMQQKAQSNIIDTIKVDNNYLNFVAICYQDDKLKRRLIYHVKLTLNGKEYKMEIPIDQDEIQRSAVEGHLGVFNDAIYSIIQVRFSKIMSDEFLKQLKLTRM